jgi:hypothetical protein
MFTIIAGDFPRDTRFISGGMPSLQWGASGILYINNKVSSVELITEEKRKDLLKSAAWGVIGAVALGPVGALAGVLAGGNKQSTCFTCVLNDGRKFMAVSDTGTYQRFVALSMASLEEEDDTDGIVDAGDSVDFNDPVLSLLYPRDLPFCLKCNEQREISGSRQASPGILEGTCTVCGSKVTYRMK